VSAPTELDLAIDRLITAALVTSHYFIPASARSRARILAKDEGTLSGLDIARRVFHRVDPRLEVTLTAQDGDRFHRGDHVLTVHGPSRSLLTAERTALNFLQRLSGIATTTRRYVDAVHPHPVKLLDTRKTLPGWRLLEKMAVRHGGGSNHRIGLYDQVMVKDNHLMACGDLTAIQAAIDAVHHDHPRMKIQLEAATLQQLSDFLTLRGVDMVLLDNMVPAMLRDAVAMNAGRLFLEASGGITLDTIGGFAATGVNAISVGALTHSARAVDLSLDIED
jgi:nicotinate-nucleotide pyrophosphorylase (carboxylating)